MTDEKKGIGTDVLEQQAVRQLTSRNVVEISGLSFRYLGRDEVAIQADNFKLKEGESVLIVGKSGEGKSTFVNCINGVIPHISGGELKGEVRVYDKLVKDTPMSKLCVDTGTLLQDPESQVLNYLVEEEVAFGPENLALPPDEIRDRVTEAIAETGIYNIRDRETYVLSGGELQRVALAAVLAMKPSLLILDEPTSNIDPAATQKIFELLRGLRGRKTMLVIEHKVERMLPYVDRIMLIEKGRISLDIPKQDLVNHIEELNEAGVEIPPTYFYAKQLGLDNVDVTYIRQKIREKGIVLAVPERRKAERTLMQVDARVSVMSKIKGQNTEKVLLDASLNLGEGEVLAMMGQNGAGKSTFLEAIMGYLDKTSVNFKVRLVVDGEDLSKTSIQTRGKYITFVPQTFELTIVTNKVESEVAYSLKQHGVKDYKSKVEELLEMYSLTEVRGKDPLALSMGQERRVAMASALGSGAKIIMLDEPTSGQDFYHKGMLGKEIRKLQTLGYSFIIVTHDSRFVYNYADRMVVLSQGHKVLEGTPEEVFLESEKYSIPPPTDYYLRV
ncbi:MAG: ATP-binding cassette domain-containing protein [Nitrososphaerota archaeon]|nr:ATP-binding cassette domain-containing protein [Nitrososphaerota archaeon]MDG7038137.1 ATP-binding cassette domain-containing protein [Nitrososphaerota archaeon]MDG7039878.1 ATP-binding cassette domain-containing protein [Nitrososphaerota archaeon]MDG7042544.1 ATP-binding cassette domain-containing protein [Nitrososphaerota archaeon]MDG7046409.1 ATP-binding cassette domain-containing protein [Nitrososphaerota archaeon]